MCHFIEFRQVATWMKLLSCFCWGPVRHCIVITGSSKMLANEEATGEGQADEIFFGKNHICGVCQFVMWNLRDGSFNENHFKSLIQESTTGKVKLYAIDLILANFVDQIWLFSHQFETVWGVFGWKLGYKKAKRRRRRRNATGADGSSEWSATTLLGSCTRPERFRKARQNTGPFGSSACW